MPEGNQPAQEIRHGLVKATIWGNPTKNGVMHRVVFSRLYKDGDEWKTSTSFARRDIFDLERCMVDAHAWLVFGPSEPRSEDPKESAA